MDAEFVPRLLVLATEACAYPGADEAGKTHKEYPSHFHILRVRSPVIFPEDFYLRCFSRGIDGILIAACGTDCPYSGAYPRLARRVDGLVQRLQDGGLEIGRVRLTAICTVCVKAFLKEVRQLNEKLTALGPVDRARAQALWNDSLTRLKAEAPAAS